MNNLFYAIIYILSIFACSCSQIFLKKSADKPHSGIRVYFNRVVIISNVVFVGATLITVVLYKYIQLSTATLLSSTSYIFILVLSAIFLKEKISKRKLMGVAFIIAGIAVYAVFDGNL